MDNPKIVILGAGLAGVELGRRLKEAGKDFIILEKESQMGGICRTNKTGDYHWDFAVHAMYSRDSEALDYYSSLPLDYEHLNRNVKVFHLGSNGKRYLLDYPFEIGVKDLPLREKLECILGYLIARARGKKRDSNLVEWVDNFLGAGIAKHFMIPYNIKIWNCNLDKISNKLVSSKIDPSPAVDFIFSALGRKTVGRAYQARFIYPKGGIQNLVDHIAKDIKDKILLNSNVERLIRRNDKWVITTDDGKKQEADIIVSTIPLVELLKKIDVEGLKKEYDALKWNNTFFIMVGLKKGYDFQLIDNCHWAFFKGDEIFYRVTLMHNLSREFPPALVAEITQKVDILNKTKDQIKDLVLMDLIRLGIIGSMDWIAETDVKLLRYTYPIPTIGLEETKKGIKDKLKQHNIFLLGRNGNWDYINMDEVIMQVKGFYDENFSS